MYSKEYAVKYREDNRELLREKQREYYKNNKERRIKENTICQTKRVRRYKLKAFEAIAKHHNSTIICWKCGEDRLWCLTIGHVNQDGKEDRKMNGNGTRFYKAVIEGIRICDDLQIECMNCNCCLQWYGKYPDEITEEEFIL
jgi:hypothetical protein